MMFQSRRLVISCVLAALIAGTAIASRESRWLKPVSQISPAPAVEKSRSLSANNSGFASGAPGPQAPETASDKTPRRQFTVYRDESGDIVCREATPAEIRERSNIDPEKQGLLQINHFELDKSVGAQAPDAANLVIVLRATQQLQQNAAATAAFNRAAQNWENIIMSPITIYLDVDFGATDFGQTWPAGVLGATGSPSGSYAYQSVRANLIAQANGEGNATKQGIFNALPSTTVPTDLGDASGVDVSNSIARAIGLLPATAQPSDDAAHIAFNSTFTFDFDPSDGITANTIDFDAVATHEIGHALGFDSDAGQNAPKPSVWDLYRFRTGATLSTFPTAQRILTIGGSPDPLQFYFVPGNLELGLSTGGPSGSSGNGGDGWQASHWKNVSGCNGAIGIMDPAIPDGCRRTITNSDTLALTSFGYNLTNSNPPPPPPPSPTPPANDNFANAQAISGCSGSTSGSTFGATREAGEPSHDPPDSTSLSPGHTVWYQWQAPSSTSTTITTNGSDFDTILAVYTGTTVNSLTRVVFNDDVQNGVIRTSSVIFNATSGTVYRIVVDGWGGDAGTLKLNWNGCPAPSPTPTATPSPTPTATPTATPVVSPFPIPTPIPAGRAVAYQINPAHTGAQSDNLNPPLTQRWSRDLGGFVSYPLIADGRVFVTVGPARLFALDEVTGANLWGPVDLGGSGPWAGIAYDAGRVFAVNYSGLLRAFDAASGAIIWSRQLPQSFFTSPPTAFGGLVYTAGSGGNGTLSAVSQQDGTIKWTASVFTAEHSSPAVSGTDVYVSYSCNLAYDFSPPTGTPLWRHTTSCFGGGGKTPVLFGNRLYIRDAVLPNTVLNASNGAELGTFSASVVPAFSGSTGYFRSGSTLQARDVSSGAVLWSFTGDGTLSSAPIVDNAYVYIGSTSGKVYALSASTGTNVWTGNVGAQISAPDEQNVSLPTTGLGAGDNLLVVPAATLLVAYQTAPVNVIDQPDFFVKQNYLDFLNRQPDQSGLDFWTGTITSCGGDPRCIEVKRINLSGAFFLSIEFQQTGFYVLRMQRAAFGKRSKDPATRMLLADWLRDVAQVANGLVVLQPGWEQVLENNKQAYATQIVNSSAFTNRYPTTLNATQYVDALISPAAVPLTAGERNAAITAFGAGGTAGRIAALRAIADAGQLTAQGPETLPGGLSATLATNEGVNREFREAFVLMQYFGYLRRDPDDSGYQFWLYKMNQFGGNYANAEMVKAFIASDEYRKRFGP